MSQKKELWVSTLEAFWKAIQGNLNDQELNDGGK